MANKRITITLSEANAWEAKLVSEVLKKPLSEIVSSCLKGSTNLAASKSNKVFYSR